MLKLTIETKEQSLVNQIQSAYNKAIECIDYNSFILCLYKNLNESIIHGEGGSHIWISDKQTNKRLAIIIK